MATTSCNNGDQPLDWLQLPKTDHPVIPQNLYRMTGGTDNTERFEQIGQSWLKHAFFALEDTVCSTCVTPMVAQRAAIFARDAPTRTLQA